MRPANQPVTRPTRPPAVSRLALRSGLRWALAANPCHECRTVALTALLPRFFRIELIGGLRLVILGIYPVPGRPTREHPEASPRH